MADVVLNEETALADALADLMYWAEQTRQTVRKGQGQATASTSVTLTDSEHATILAALRVLQCRLMERFGQLPADLESYFHVPGSRCLSPDEIEEFSSRIHPAGFVAHMRVGTDEARRAVSITFHNPAKRAVAQTA